MVNELESSPSFPQGLWQRIKRINRLFVFCVILPTALAVIYFGLLASDVYVSESRFVIRSAQKQSGGSALLGAFLQGTGFAHSQDDTYAVNDFLESRDAVALLNKDGALVKAYSQNGDSLFQRFPGFGLDQSFESLLKYYLRHIVTVDYDTTSAITTLTVDAFTPEDAQRINLQLLHFGEQLVNRLNARASTDLVKFAQQEVAAAEERLKVASTALSVYRNKNAVFDPEKQSALQLTQATKMEGDLTQARVELAELISVAPANPRVASLKLRISTLENQIAATGSGVTGGNSSLSNKAVGYERLELDRQFADKQLAAAMAALETARNDARRQQLYLERLVEPNLPDLAIQPKRLKGVFEVLVLGMLVWGVLSLLIAGVREHHN